MLFLYDAGIVGAMCAVATVVKYLATSPLNVAASASVLKITKGIAANSTKRFLGTFSRGIRLTLDIRYIVKECIAALFIQRQHSQA